MADIIELKTNLDLKNNFRTTVTCKQLDTLKLIIDIWDSGAKANLSGYRCRLKAVKSDDEILIQNTEIEVVDNKVTILADTQLTNTSGNVEAELEFIDTDTNKKKHTFNLIIKVVASVLDVERGISKSVITLLEELDDKLDRVEVVGDLLDEAKQINKKLETNTANGTTLNTNLENNITDATTIKNDLIDISNESTKLKDDLVGANVSANINKIELDKANKQAEINIETMSNFGDVTNLAQNVQANTTKLDKFTEDENGDLLYNGEKISADSTADAVTTTPISGLAGDSNVQNCLELLNSKFSSLKSYTGDKTYYVDETNGDDTNDGLTTDTPFKTIGKAWKMIPTFFNSGYTIKIIGDYSNSVFFDAKIATGFSNRIIIMSNDKSNISTITRDWYFVNVQSVGYGTSTIYAGLYLDSLKFVGAGIQFYGCKEGYVNNCIFYETTSMTNFVYVYNSNVTVSKNTFTGKTSSGLSLIYAARHSSLYSYSNTYNTSKIATACYVNSNITSNSDTFTSITTNNTKDGSSNFTKN